MRWQTWEIDGGSYLLDIKQYGKLYLGAWVSADTLYNSLGTAGAPRSCWSATRASP